MTEQKQPPSSAKAAPMINQNDAPALQIRQEKIDPITALQEAIDGLSLAMFEALRGLRDAVAPESGNLGKNTNNTATTNDEGSAAAAPGTTNNNEPDDVDELWRNYCSGDEAAVALVNEYNDNSQVIRNYDDFLKFHQHMNCQKDAKLVETLAAAVLEKSRQIDCQVSESLPGMHRTQSQQMSYIQTLIDQNVQAAAELESTYHTALARRNACRKYVLDKTSLALGIEEEE